MSLLVVSVQFVFCETKREPSKLLARVAQFGLELMLSPAATLHPVLESNREELRLRGRAFVDLSALLRVEAASASVLVRDVSLLRMLKRSALVLVYDSQLDEKFDSDLWAFRLVGTLPFRTPSRAFNPAHLLWRAD